MVRNIFAAVLFVLLLALYVYMVIAAIGNLIMLPELAATLDLSVNAAGWFWLWLGVALPIIFFALAFIVARGRRVGAKLLVLATALAVTAALQLEISLLVPPLSFFV